VLLHWSFSIGRVCQNYLLLTQEQACHEGTLFSKVVKMSGEKLPVNRALVGFLTLACLGAVLVLWFFAPEDDKRWRLILAALVRVGCLMAAFWLALPTRHRKAAWADVSPTTFVGILLAIVGVAVRPRIAIPILIVLVFIGLVLRPREKKRPGSRSGRNT